MAYDENLAERIRELLADEPDLVDKRMFGGLAFMVGGRMAVVARNQGGLMVRVAPDQANRLADSGGARVVEMRGRLMTGWLQLDADQLRTERALATWVGRGVEYARSLPAK